MYSDILLFCKIINGPIKLSPLGADANKGSNNGEISLHLERRENILTNLLVYGFKKCL